jgi:hypothetical protein
MRARREQIGQRCRLLVEALEAGGAVSPGTALTDAQISRRTGLPRRDIIDLAAEAAEIDVAVLASCGSGREGSAGKGRYIERDPKAVREHGEALHKRAATIHRRGWLFKRLANRMEAKRRVETNGQGRLWA